MKHVGHFIAGESVSGASGSQILNRSNGQSTAIAARRATFIYGGV